MVGALRWANVDRLLAPSEDALNDTDTSKPVAVGTVCRVRKCYAQRYGKPSALSTAPESHVAPPGYGTPTLVPYGTVIQTTTYSGVITVIIKDDTPQPT